MTPAMHAKLAGALQTLHDYWQTHAPGDASVDPETAAFCAAQALAAAEAAAQARAQADAAAAQLPFPFQ